MKMSMLIICSDYESVNPFGELISRNSTTLPNEYLECIVCYG